MSKVFISSAVGAIIAAVAVWYFFIKEFDYTISFLAPNSPGEVHQILLNYNYDNFKNIKILENVPFSSIKQKASLENNPIKLTWQFEPGKEEENTHVTLGINNIYSSFFSRAKFLWGGNAQQKLITAEVKILKEALEIDKELYRIEVIGETISPASSCICIPLKNNVRDKALDMMKNIQKLSDFIIHYNVEMTARPRIYVSSWNLESNFIDYQFCFPINPASLPQDSLSTFNIKEFPEKKSIMAIYNGNYMHSHLAWPKILDYAEKNHIKVELAPLEIFYDNPEMGGDSRNWKAEVYFPVKEQSR